MDKIILVARLGKFFSDFELSDIDILQSMGYEVWCVGNYDNDNHKLDSTGVKKVHLDFERSPLSLKNIKAYKQLVQIIRDNDFKLMHCHMPIGGVFARLAAHKAGLKPVIYTAHGFQFCKGGPIRDWILFYPVEKFLSRYADILITINQEDYSLASKRFNAKRTILLHGVGVDIERIRAVPSKRERLCEELAIDPDSKLVLSVGELNKNKNHETAIRGFSEFVKDLGKFGENYHYLIAGVGNLDKYLNELVLDLGVEKQVHFLGWRDDVYALCKSVDVFCFPSKREGLPVSVMEAMAAGLPVIASAARGNTELIKDDKNGFICLQNGVNEYKNAFNDCQRLINRKEIVFNYSYDVLKEYEINGIRSRMKDIYISCR